MKALLLALALSPLAACAHDPGLSSATVDFGAREIFVQMAFSPADLGTLQPSGYAGIAARSVELRAQNVAIKPSSVEVREMGAEDVEFTLRFPRPSGVALLRAPLLPALPFGHRLAVTFRDAAGVTVLTEVLSAARDSVSLPVVARAADFPSDPPRDYSMRMFVLAALGVAIALALGSVWLARHRSMIPRALTGGGF